MQQCCNFATQDIVPRSGAPQIQQVSMVDGTRPSTPRRGRYMQQVGGALRTRCSRAEPARCSMPPEAEPLDVVSRKKRSGAERLRPYVTQTYMQQVRGKFSRSRYQMQQCCNFTTVNGTSNLLISANYLWKRSKMRGLRPLFLVILYLCYRHIIL